MKTLLAVDGSRYTKRMLAYLAAHDDWFGSTQHQFTVLTVVGPIPARAASALDKKIVHDYYKDEAETTFKPIRAFFAKQGISATFEYRVGNAGDHIAEFARKGKFDLVMMGSHGHGVLTRLVVGSVTGRVLAASDVPLLIIR
ncbi:MAG TPA: universal stress protein [Burkholderiaceae bacterium]|nr:universal stress protein [Burkholderiaceae bacterium]